MYLVPTTSRVLPQAFTKIRFHDINERAVHNQKFVRVQVLVPTVAAVVTFENLRETVNVFQNAQ